MELLAEHRDKYNSVVELYYFSSNQTEKYWGRDNLAALKIQSKFKMYMKRKEFLRMKAGISVSSCSGHPHRNSLSGPLRTQEIHSQEATGI